MPLLFAMILALLTLLLPAQQALGMIAPITYLSAPTVTGISPSNGSMAGGTTVTITGTNLTGASAVTFGTAAGTIVSITSGTSITATSPAGSAGAVDVTVTTAFGTSATNTADQFTYMAPLPVVIPKIIPGLNQNLLNATHLVISAPATAVSGTPFSFTVTAQTQLNSTASGYTGTVHFTSSDTAASLPADTTLTNGTGAFSTTLNTSGSQTITAADTSSASITGVSNSIAVSANGVRFEYDGMIMWYGTPDAPAPTGALSPSSGTNQVNVAINVAVQPPSVSNTVEVTYRVNGGSPATVTASLQRQDLVNNTQYYSAQLPAFKEGDTVDYNAVARSPGKQVPDPGGAAMFPSSFWVVPAGTTPPASVPIVLHFHIGSTDSDINGLAQLLDTAPVISKGRTFLPIKFVVGPLGATTNWDPSQKMVTVTLGSTNIRLWMSQGTANVNGVATPIDPGNPGVTPMIVKGRTMLPLAFIAKSLGCKVLWDANANEVTVTS